jgi:hypothetical protein
MQVRWALAAVPAAWPLEQTVARISFARVHRTWYLRGNINAFNRHGIIGSRSQHLRHDSALYFPSFLSQWVMQPILSAGSIHCTALQSLENGSSWGVRCSELLLPLNPCFSAPDWR